MKSDEYEIYTKIVNLDDFVVDKLFIWNCLKSKKIILSSQILKFKI